MADPVEHKAIPPSKNHKEGRWVRQWNLLIRWSYHKKKEKKKTIRSYLKEKRNP